MDAYSEGSGLLAHLIKGICCGYNWPTTSIIHYALGGNHMDCWDWSKLTIPLEWASFLSLQFSLCFLTFLLCIQSCCCECCLNNVTFCTCKVGLKGYSLTCGHFLIVSCCNDWWQWPQNEVCYTWGSGTLPVDPGSPLFSMRWHSPHCCTQCGHSPELLPTLPPGKPHNSWIVVLSQWKNCLKKPVPIPSFLWRINGTRHGELPWLSSLK